MKERMHEVLTCLGLNNKIVRNENKNAQGYQT